MPLADNANGFNAYASQTKIIRGLKINQRDMTNGVTLTQTPPFVNSAALALAFPTAASGAAAGSAPRLSSPAQLAQRETVPTAAPGVARERAASSPAQTGLQETQTLAARTTRTSSSPITLSKASKYITPLVMTAGLLSGLGDRGEVDQRDLRWKAVDVNDMKQASQPKLTRITDKYNVPPTWDAYVASANKGTFDLSRYKFMVLALSQEGSARNMVVEIIDQKGRSKRLNDDHVGRMGDLSGEWALSHVYTPSSKDTTAVINLNDFIRKVDLKKVTEIRITMGDNYYTVPLNTERGNIVIKGVDFTNEEMTVTPNVPYKEFKESALRKAEEIRKQRAATAQKPSLPRGVFERETAVLAKGFLKNRIATIRSLVDKIRKGSTEDRKYAKTLLLREANRPEQHINLRRYIYSELKNIFGPDIYKDIWDDSVKRAYEVREPIVVDLLSNQQVRDWVAAKRLAMGKENPPEIREPVAVRHVLDRNVMERLAYWSMVMNIDPMTVTFPTVYTESLLGAHPEKTYNIMTVHAADQDGALDSEGRKLRDAVLAEFGQDSTDRMLDLNIVTGLILMQNGFNTYENGQLAQRLQGYNGYGRYPWAPFEGVSMREFPAIGMMIEKIGQKMPAALQKIVDETAAKYRLTVPKLPSDLRGYQIGIKRDTRKDEMMTLVNEKINDMVERGKIPAPKNWISRTLAQRPAASSPTSTSQVAPRQLTGGVLHPIGELRGVEVGE
ncbi:MAG: hypothetical protein JW847_05695, partial [Candidatus Omnitrophica bacterium]|nr:hypothetical protein [Candidatus Omnitrophota bacterium]